MSDLLKNLGSKETSGVKQTATQSTSTSDPTIGANTSRGENLIDKAGKKVEETETTTLNVSDESLQNSKEEPTVKSDTSTWTIENALKEVKKLREENKATRVKYEESLERLKGDTEQRIAAREKELEKYLTAQQELEELKTKEADKKRDITEKLAHREAMLAEIKTKADMAERTWNEKLTKLETQVQRYEAEAQAQQQVYQTRLEEELKVVPEKFKSVASLIVKGAGDPRDALIALNEAKLQGVFEDKTVIVNHSVPGAHDGARATNERLEEAKRAERSKLTSSAKIKTALSDIRSGAGNSAFRIK